MNLTKPSNVVLEKKLMGTNITDRSVVSFSNEFGNRPSSKESKDKAFHALLRDNFNRYNGFPLYHVFYWITLTIRIENHHSKNNKQVEW